MRHIFESTKDITYGLGDRSFANKKGDKLEVSAAWAERILREPALAEAYKLVEDVPETDEETAKVEAQKTKAKLMSVPKDTLVKRAERKGIATEGLKKEAVAEALVEKSTEGETK